MRSCLVCDAIDAIVWVGWMFGCCRALSRLIFIWHKRRSRREKCLFVAIGSSTPLRCGVEKKKVKVEVESNVSGVYFMTLLCIHKAVARKKSHLPVASPRSPLGTYVSVETEDLVRL